MDEQAGLQEHQRTAPCPQLPRRPTQPPTPEPGSRPGPRGRRPPRRGRSWGSELERVELLHSCSWCPLDEGCSGPGSRARLVLRGKLVHVVPGLRLDGALVPLNHLHRPFRSSSLQHTFKRSLPESAGAWRRKLSADGCLLGPRVRGGGGVMRDTGEVGFVCFVE